MHDASLLLLVDAGNTRTKIGWMEPRPADAPLPACLHFEAVGNLQPLEWQALLARLGAQAETTSVCITGSNPRRVLELQGSFPQGWPPPLELPSRRDLPLAIDVDVPDRVGIDRLLNAIAANRLRSGRGGDDAGAILVDSGTATTIDYVSPDGRFCGGAILPGFELCAKALHEYTALLPLVPLAPVLESPPSDLGRNTEAAIASGLYWGHVGAVRELLRRMMQRAASEPDPQDPGSRHLGNIGSHELPLVLVTGGAAPLLMPHLPSGCTHAPHLALQGLALVVDGLLATATNSPPRGRTNR